MPKLVLFLLSILFFAGCGETVQLTPEVRKAADKYLTFLDRDEYQAVWLSSASIFKEVVSADAWREQMKASREKLGKAKTRNQRDAISQINPSNHPPGEYILINFDTGFERDEAVETLILYKEEVDWLLAGYFIK